MENLILLILLTPGVVFLFLSLIWLCGGNPREKFISRLTGITYTFIFICSLVLAYQMISHHGEPIQLSFGNWFAVHGYSFPLIIVVDQLSLPLMILTTVLVGLVAVFSTRYLHREKGFYRFFILLHLFAFGALLIFSAGSLDLLVGGWEMVGITSVLLVAFFQERPDPVRCAFRVFVTYRTCDIGLLVAVFVLHHATGTATFSQLFSGAWPHQVASISNGTALAAGLLLLFAASGKAAQFPFSGWLPRAMEGPTPSSAIFYGAISVHAGAYLLLRTYPIFSISPFATFGVIAVGLATAIGATIISRACSDTKTAIAYSAMAQLGLIFMEIGFGFQWLALLHIVGHSIIRTLQFLRSPSMLREFHQVRDAVGGQLEPTGVQYEKLFPASVQAWLYRFALERGHQDALLDRMIVNPSIRLSGWLNSYEHRIAPSVRKRKLTGTDFQMRSGNQLTDQIVRGIDG